MSDMPDRIFVDAEGEGTDWWTNNHLREDNPDEVVIRYAWTEEYIRADKYAELEEHLKSARNDGFDMCKADYREQFAEYDERIAELEEQNKRMVELLKASVAEFDDGIKYPLEVVNDLKQVLASKEKDDE